MSAKGYARKIWEDYQEAVFRGIPVHSIQKLETRKAYYAGIFDTLSFLLPDAIAGLPEEEAAEKMDQLLSEVRSEVQGLIVASERALAQRKQAPPQEGGKR